MSMQTQGVAPEWAATGDGAYSIPEGYTCVGFYVTTAGTVSLESFGSNKTVNYPANFLAPAHVTAFNAGGTATGVYALLAK